MKKIITVILILCLGIITSFAQVATHMFEKGKVFEKHSKLKLSLNNPPEKKMPVFDVTPLLEEDKAMKGLDVPFRFGKSFEVNITLKDGKSGKVSNTFGQRFLSVSYASHAVS